MTELKELTLRIRTTASCYQCDACPPDRVCAWACLQGASPEDIVIAASLVLDGVPGWYTPVVEGAEPTHDALWGSFNA